jgi:sec-independent protein translocase protein TatB
MFDISWSELLILLVVALIVVGPKDLPKLMRKAGQWAGRARAMADQFRKSFDEMARQAELDELRAEVEKLKQGTKPLSEFENEANAAMSGIPSSPTAPYVNVESPPDALDFEPPEGGEDVEHVESVGHVEPADKPA